MKITVISHAYQEDRYLATWDAIAAHRDVEVSLIRPERYHGQDVKRHAPHPCVDIPVPVIFGSRQGGFLYRPGELRIALDQSRPDLIVHEQEVYALSAAQIAASAHRRSIPLVQFVWENVDRQLAFPRGLVRCYLLARANALVAGSSQARSIHERWGFRGSIAVIPQMSVRTAAVPRFDMHETKTLRVCFIGRLVACKGVDVLLQAIAILHRRGFRVDCAIAGRGPRRAHLAALARSLGIWSLVHFCGHLAGAAVGRLLRSSDVLVLPSRRTSVWEEQFGLVLAEAMAEGTVTVGSRTGAIPEVIGTEQLLFGEDDAPGLAEILRTLAIDPEFHLWSRLHGWQRARQRFETEVVADQKLQFFRAVLDRGYVQANEPKEVSYAMPVGTR